MAKTQKGNTAALNKEHIPFNDFIFWWQESKSVDDFVATAKDSGYDITKTSAIARAGRIRKTHTKKGRLKVNPPGVPLKWMGASPSTDKMSAVERWLEIYGEKEE